MFTSFTAVGSYTEGHASKLIKQIFTRRKESPLKMLQSIHKNFEISFPFYLRLCSVKPLKRSPIELRSVNSLQDVKEDLGAYAGRLEIKEKL